MPLDNDATLVTATSIQGQLIAGRYRLDTLLKRGQSGSIWRASDMADKTAVALKLLRGHRTAVPGAGRRFEREALLLTHLRHPNIVRCYDYGVRKPGEWYLVLELLEGQTLEERLDRADSLGPLRSREVRRLVLDLLQALSEAHAMGVVHRDVSLSHILLTADGLKLLDWGIAQTLRHDVASVESCAVDIRAVGQVLQRALEAGRGGAMFRGPLVNLSKSMRAVDPSARPTTQEALGALASMSKPYLFRVT